MKKLLILLLVPLFAMSQTNPNRESIGKQTNGQQKKE